MVRPPFVNRTKSGFSHPGKNGNIGITGNYTYTSGYSWDTALIKLRDEIYQYHIYFHLLRRENISVNRTKSCFSHPGKNGNIGITGNYHISMNKKIRFE